MHPKVEVTQVEDAASAAAASGASDSEDGNFFNTEMTVMISGILAGGVVSFGLFMFVGFVCVQLRRRQTQCPSNNYNAASASTSNKSLLQVSVLHYRP